MQSCCHAHTQRQSRQILNEWRDDDGLGLGLGLGNWEEIDWAREREREKERERERERGTRELSRAKQLALITCKCNPVGPMLRWKNAHVLFQPLLRLSSVGSPSPPVSSR
jgi:hypothetical protein